VLTSSMLTNRQVYAVITVIPFKIRRQRTWLQKSTL
jgi:hypothetical protein